jgi:hypothetical protein
MDARRRARRLAAIALGSLLVVTAAEGGLVSGCEEDTVIAARCKERFDGCHRSNEALCAQFDRKDPARLEACRAAIPDRCAASARECEAKSPRCDAGQTCIKNACFAPESRRTATSRYPQGGLEARWEELVSGDRRVKDGSYEHYHRDGAVQERGQYRLGKKEGSWTQWYDRNAGGRRFAEGQYRNGLKDGVWTTYWSNGRPSFRGTYENGNLVGQPENWSTEGRPLPRQ